MEIMRLDLKKQKKIPPFFAFQISIDADKYTNPIS